MVYRKGFQSVHVQRKKGVVPNGEDHGTTERRTLKNYRELTEEVMCVRVQKEIFCHKNFLFFIMLFKVMLWEK